MAQSRCLVCASLLSEGANFCRKCGTRTLPSSLIDPLDTKETDVSAATPPETTPPPPPPPPQPEGVRITKLIDTPTFPPSVRETNPAARAARPTTPVGRDTDGRLPPSQPAPPSALTDAAAAPPTLPAATLIPPALTGPRERLAASPAPAGLQAEPEPYAPDLLAGSLPPTARIEIPLEKSVEVPDTAEFASSAPKRRWVLRILGVGVLVLASWAWFSFKRAPAPPAPETLAASTPAVAESQPSATVAVLVEPSPEATSEPPLPAPSSAAALEPTPKPTVSKAAKPTPALAPSPTRAAAKPSPPPAAKPSPPPAARTSPTSAPKPPPRNPTVTAIERIKHGNEHLASGQYANALREFEQARRLEPGNKDVFYLLGQAYQGMGDTGRALQAYRQCTSGVYASTAQKHVKNLEKKQRKVQAPR